MQKMRRASDEKVAFVSLQKKCYAQVSPKEFSCMKGGMGVTIGR